MAVPIHVSTVRISCPELLFLGGRDTHICYNFAPMFTRLCVDRPMSVIVDETFCAFHLCNFPSRLILLFCDNNV